jgi:hypothetical protein
MAYKDSEVVGLDKDGCVVQWSAENHAPYNCGETPEEFGVANLTEVELLRLRRDGWASGSLEVKKAAAELILAGQVNQPSASQRPSVCDACGTGEHVFVLSQRDMDDESVLEVVSAHRTMQGAVAARAAIWSDEDFQKIYGGTEREHFTIIEYKLHD